MKSQAFIDMAVSLVICLLFVMLLVGIYLRTFGPVGMHVPGLASSINGTSRFIGRLVEQLHFS